jgi:hypothetical protein
MRRLSTALIPIKLEASNVRCAAGEYCAGNIAKGRHLLTIFPTTGGGVGGCVSATIRPSRKHGHLCLKLRMTFLPG